MSPRYALYLAPSHESALWRFGSRVIGRDAATGEPIEGYAPPGFLPETWREMTAEPRRYGFHATLKAPFRLREGRTLEELETAIEALASNSLAFDLGALHPTALAAGGGETGFVALTPVRRSAELAALEARAVRDLDDFRSPPTTAEIARRRPDRLSERQRDHLAAWGYPYVLEEFRLHFTLTGAVAAPQALADRLTEDFARDAPDPNFAVDALVLFEQSEGAPFLIRRRFPLAGRLAPA